MLATEGKWQTREHTVDWRRAVAAALAASLCLSILLAIFLVVRRLDGALAPLPFVPLLLTAAVLAAWAYAIRAWFSDQRLSATAACVILLIAIGCSASSGRIADWLVWSAALAAPILVPIRTIQHEDRSRNSPEVTLQQLTRTRSADGLEAIRGTLVAEFAPAERLAVLYVAFCPPLERVPSVTCEVAAGPLCEVKVAQIFHQGARIEARLLRASTAAAQVKISFSAFERSPIAT